MNYYINEYIERTAKVAKELEALTFIYGDFATLNSSRRKERSAIRTLVDDLTEEQAELKLALEQGRIINYGTTKSDRKPFAGTRFEED